MPFSNEEFVHRKVRFFINYLRDMDNISEVSNNFPANVYIEAAGGICTYKCVNCPQGLGMVTRERGLMTMDTFQRSIDKIADHAAEITFALWGEPTVNKNLPDFIKYASEKGLHTSLINNGSRMLPELSQKLIDSGLNRIVFSLDVTEASLYKEVRVQGVFEKTLFNAFNFLKLNVEQGSKVWVMASMVENDSEDLKDRFEEYYSQLPFNQIYVSRYNNMQGHLPKRDEFIAEKKKTVAENKRPICTTPWRAMSIHWEGSVTACITDFNGYYYIGNILDDNTATELWNNDEIKALRRGLISSDDSHAISKGLRCDNCSHRYQVSDIAFTNAEVEKHLCNEILKEDKIFTTDSTEYKVLLSELSRIRQDLKPYINKLGEKNPFKVEVNHQLDKGDESDSAFQITKDFERDVDALQYHVDEKGFITIADSK